MWIARLWNVHSNHFSFRRSFAPTIALGFALLGLAVCVRADENNNQNQNSTPSLGRLVVIGDSLSAGFQNGTLMACQQVNGFANLVAAQAGTPLVLPLIGFPGLPPITSAVPPVGRINPFSQATDVAVPGQTVAEALSMTPVYGTPVPPNPFDPSVFPALPAGAPPPAGVQTLTNFILGFPGVFASPQIALSQAQWANALGPNTVVVWIGNNDVIGVFEGVQTRITDPVAFAQQFEQLLSSLDSNNRRLVVANLPDATLTPFLSQLLANNLPLRLTVQGVTLAYNAAIFASALRHHAAFVNIYELVNNLAARGIVVNGVRLTTQAGGGLFSLDGIHPTNTGYAVIANAFIRSMNQAFDADIAPVNLGSVAAADPLFPANVTNPPALCTAP